jgi:MATE family multidrug resistance protein
MELIYFQILVWGSGGMLVSQSASAFFGGQGRTAIVMWVDSAFAIVNLVLDYFWIFGIAGFPEMGIAGAGYATILSLWLKAAFYVWLMLRHKEDQRFATRSRWRPDWSLIRRMLRYGGPAGLQMMIDVAGFTMFVMLVGRLGPIASEATTMAFSISSFAFMPVYGFGQAAGILVGQHLGENREGLAARSAWTTVIVGMLYMVFISTLYVVVPGLFLWGFFEAGESVKENPEQVRELAIVLLRFVAAFNLFDAALTIFSGALKGAGDTTFILLVSLVMGVVLAVVSYIAVVMLSAQVFACWQIITAWVCVGGVVYVCRFLGGKWRNMRVIEQN